MKLTEHFTLNELTRSNTAQELGLDNTPGPDALPTTAPHGADVGARARPSRWQTHDCEQQLSQSAGKFCRRWETTSDHLQGMAADVVVPGYGTPYEVAKALAPHAVALGIGQIIYEINKKGSRWIHLSTRIPAQTVNRVITIHGKQKMVGIQPV